MKDPQQLLHELVLEYKVLLERINALRVVIPLLKDDPKEAPSRDEPFE